MDQRNFNIPSSWVNAPEFVPNYCRNLVPMTFAASTPTSTSSYGMTSYGRYIPDRMMLPNDSQRNHRHTMVAYKTGAPLTQLRKDDMQDLFVAATCCSLLDNPPRVLAPLRKDFANEDDFVSAMGKYMEAQLCPFHVVGECHFANGRCNQIHGNLCEMCNNYVLHPHSSIQNKWHKKECLKKIVEDMELSFAIAETAEKRCGICLEVVMEKESVADRRFGILLSCQHCFCLSCIRRWRKVRNLDNQTIRSCPECRVVSHFVIPSRAWVGNKEAKDAMVRDYKLALSRKPCKYYNRIDRFCPFGSSCFYKHEDPIASGTGSGTVAQVTAAAAPPPTTSSTALVPQLPLPAPAADDQAQAYSITATYEPSIWISRLVVEVNLVDY